MVSAIDVFLGQNRGAGGNAANEWQGQLGKTRQGQAEQVGVVANAVARRSFESNASRGAADQVNGAFSSQGLQVFFCGVG